jgi:SAM-dependent methyltransferase
MKQPPPTVAAYDAHAPELSQMYESLAFEDAHQSILDLIPTAPGRVLDVGAGSGRDAAWFAYRGHEVVAVEPSDNMRRQARERHADPRIRWIDDALPGLTHIHRLGLQYELVLASAVWMHVPPEERKRAFRKLATLLAPSGRLVISLRFGPSDYERTMYPVSRAEVERLGQELGLRVLRIASGNDRLGRPDVRWEILVLEYPDDETGALPLLRHIVLRDDKSSTYKLALLRVVARIADSAPGLAYEDDDGNVCVPLGLVALYWIRSMKPLVEADYPQTPTNRDGKGLGFVKPPFHALRNTAAFDLRPGMRFSGETAKALSAALGDAARTICDMPATYITYPGSGEQVLRTSRKALRIQGQELVLDEPCLRALGDFIIPAAIWRTLVHLNVWIEPVLLGEWIALMQQYALRQARTLAYDALARALAWLDPVRDTRLARERAIALIETGTQVRCVWSNQRLTRETLDVDHCFPFAAWPCSDLWNLLPSSRQVNQRLKRDKLVTLERLTAAQGRMLDWWSSAWTQSSAVWRPRFFEEARSSLPLRDASTAGVTLEDVFDGVQVRRALLRQDQRLPEWTRE